MNPASLANLQAFATGHDSRRRKAQNAGATYREWLSHFNAVSDDGTAAYSEDDLKRIAGDAKAQPAKRAAAETWLATYERGRTKSGVRLAADDLDRIIHNTDGKPKQVVEHQQDTARTRAELLVKLAALEAKSPGLLAQVQRMVQDGTVPTLDDGTSPESPADAPCGQMALDGPQATLDATDASESV